MKKSETSSTEKCVPVNPNCFESLLGVSLVMVMMDFGNKNDLP